MAEDGGRRRIPSAEPGFATRHHIDEDELSELTAAAALKEGDSIPFELDASSGIETVAADKTQNKQQEYKASVMLVDDEEAVLLAIGDLLRQRQYKVVDLLVTPTNVRYVPLAVKKKIRTEGPIDVILLDVNIDSSGIQSGPLVGIQLAKMMELSDISEKIGILGTATDTKRDILPLSIIDFYSGYKDRTTIEMMIGEMAEKFDITPQVHLKNELATGDELEAILARRIGVLDAAPFYVPEKRMLKAKLLKAAGDYKAIQAALSEFVRRITTNDRITEPSVKEQITKEIAAVRAYLGKEKAVDRFTYSDLLTGLESMAIRRVYTTGNGEQVPIKVLSGVEGVGALGLIQTLRKVPDMIAEATQRLAVYTEGEYTIYVAPNQKDGLLKLTYEAKIKGAVHVGAVKNIMEQLRAERFRYMYCNATSYGGKVDQEGMKVAFTLLMKNVFV